MTAAGTAVLAQAEATWWVVGWAVGGAVVVVVVLLAGTIIALAVDVRGQARDITTALRQAHANTTPLWELRQVRGAVSEIVYDLRRGRDDGEGAAP